MNGLIGATGFVGTALSRQTHFHRKYSSSNLDEARGQRFDLLVCAAPSSEKWRANADPLTDLASLDRLLEVLDLVAAQCVVLISTIDVYPTPVGVDEDSEIDESVLSPYGRHRRRLERHVIARFDRHLIVRLPAIFGPGLRKNVIFDLLHGDLRFVNPASVLQFYDIERAWGDVRIGLERNLSILNAAIEPLSVDTIAQRVFHMNIEASASPAARYDMRTKHAHHFGRTGPYLAGAASVLEGLSDFRDHQRIGD